MLLPILLATHALAGDPAEDEADVRFTGVESAPVESAAQPWRGGARSELSSASEVESRLRSMGVRPEDAVLVSAQLNWGSVSREHPDRLAFTGAGLTVWARRLSDGELLHQGTVVDASGTYDLSDPKQRDKLCTRARAGDLGTLELLTWTAEEAATDPSFLMVEDEAQRTAMIDLQPGESATVVEVVAPEGRRKKLKVRRSLTIERGDKVITLTEGDVLQRVCLEF